MLQSNGNAPTFVDLQTLHILQTSNGTIDALLVWRKEVSDMKSNGYRVLVIDDDLPVLDLLENVLTEDGYEVITCSGGQEAIDKIDEMAANNDMPSLVLTDLNMPDVSGVSIISMVKQLDAHQPIMVVTGWLKDLMLEGILESNHVRILRKPFTIPRLLSTVDHSVHQQSA